MNKIQLSIIMVFLPIVWSPAIPIHYIPLENIKWNNWIDPKDTYSLQYPSLNDWKVLEGDNQNISNFLFKFSSIDNSNYFDDGYDFTIIHNESNLPTLKTSFDAIPLEDVKNKYEFLAFKPTSSYLDLLIANLESKMKIDSSNFQVVEKHSDKYTIDGNKASGILTRHAPSLGNSYGMLTLYSIDTNNDLLLKYNYISDANAFMTYLPIAEKILDSIKILK
ncbi:MAG TPA: hypothetical protein VJ697_09295 [Nitrososphaeraceae archaeon]|nr:hypothetical protein [Nitrososphaeraceae archaeon]